MLFFIPERLARPAIIIAPAAPLAHHSNSIPGGVRRVEGTIITIITTQSVYCVRSQRKSTEEKPQSATTAESPAW